MPPANLTTIKVFEHLANLPQPLIRMIRLSGLNSILQVSFFEMTPHLAWDIRDQHFCRCSRWVSRRKLLELYKA